MDRPPPKLDYAPTPPWHQRRQAKWVKTCAVVVLVGVIVWMLAPVAWRRVQAEFWIRRCMRYTAKPQQVVITMGTAIKNAQVPSEWATLYGLLSPPGATSQGTLFLHERISPSGNRRLVAVDAASIMYYGGIAFLGLGEARLVSRVIQPGSFTLAPSEVYTKYSQVPMQGMGTYYAGQIDTADSSHFTIRRKEGFVEHIIDGWLMDDDTVRLEPRAGAPTATAPSVAD